jgi:hypothetical protein
LFCFLLRSPKCFFFFFFFFFFLNCQFRMLLLQMSVPDVWTRRRKTKDSGTCRTFLLSKTANLPQKPEHGCIVGNDNIIAGFQEEMLHQSVI